jgi:hypothetical protein
MPLRRIDEIPPETVGFEAIGEVDDDAWEGASGSVHRHRRSMRKASDCRYGNTKKEEE